MATESPARMPEVDPSGVQTRKLELVVPSDWRIWLLCWGTMTKTL